MSSATTTSPNAITPPQDVTISVKKKLDPEGEFRAFTSVAVDIFLCNRKVGNIEATIVNRSKIPSNLFLSAMDGVSAEMQFIGVSLFEPKRGRTKLQSLAEDDKDSREFMYIAKLHVADECKVNGSSEVGALALHKLLNHTSLKKVKTAIYILDATESLTEAEREKELADEREDFHARMMGFCEDEVDESEQERQGKQKVRMRADANQFLRSGFIQEPAMVGNGDERIMVSSSSRWSKPIKSHQEVASIELAKSPATGRPETAGNDLKIRDLVGMACAQAEDSTMGTAQIVKLVVEINNLVSQGGSIARSDALHCACVINTLAVVEAILEMDPATINVPDSLGGATPLMVAAERVAGCVSSAGIPVPETDVVDLLLRRGADRSIQDLQGMTAYGRFTSRVKEYDVTMHALTGGAVSRDGLQDPTVRAFQARLLPPGGSTASDRVGGETDGFVHYDD